MKKLILCLALIIPAISSADNGQKYYRVNNGVPFVFLGNNAVPPFLFGFNNSIGLVTSGAEFANPDRRRVAGSALILKSMHEIDDPTIPSNAIVKVTYMPPENTIASLPPEFHSVTLDPTTEVITIDHPPMEKYQVTPYDNGEPYPIK